MFEIDPATVHECGGDGCHHLIDTDLNLCARCAHTELVRLRGHLAEIRAAASRGTASSSNDCTYCPNIKFVATHALDHNTPPADATRG